MAPERPERDGYEVALEAKIAAWQAALNAYRAAKAVDGSLGETNLGSGLQTPSLKGAPLGSFDLPVGALRTKSVPDAIRLYLSAARQKQTNKEIAVGLRQGGLETTAGNFEANIAAALFRLKKAGVVLRFKDGWDLAEHYPDHIRNKLENGAKPKAASRSEAKPKRQKAPPSKRATTRRATAEQDGPSIDARIAAYVAARPMQVFSPAELGKAVNESDFKRVAMALARLQGRGKVIKRTDGEYAAPRAADIKAAV